MTRLLLALALFSGGLQSAGDHSVSFSIRGDRARGWPAKTLITISNASSKLERVIEASDARKPVTIRLPAGAYRMSIVAEHHRVVTRELLVDKDLSLPEIALAPIPAISGRVVARQKDVEFPLVGAQILAGPKQLATTDDQGLFRAELVDEPAPAAILVMHSSRAPKLVPLSGNLAADNELGTIELPRGVTLTVRLDRRFDDSKTMIVSLIEKRTIGSREVKPSEDEVKFSDLTPGLYRIVLKGTEPLEMMTDTVEVKEEDLEHEVVIAPFPLDGRVLLGNESLRGGGKMVMDGPRNSWRAEAPVDDDGRFGGTMWQEGKVTGLLTTTLNATPIVEVSPELGPGPTAWTIMLKRRVIQGRVIDADTKEPVAGATIEIDISSGERRSSDTLRAQKDGSYSLMAMQNGRYDLRVAAHGRLEARRRVVMDEYAEGQIIDFALEGSVATVVSFVWPDERPVVGAELLTADGKGAVTDTSGRLTIHLRAGGRQTGWIAPREGSFAFVEAAAPRNGSAPPMRVVVPSPAGSLRIAVFDKNHKPVRRPVFISLYGRQVPADILQRRQGAGGGSEGVFRLLHLPAGAYEVAAIGARSVRVAVSMGEESVELLGAR